MSRFTVVWGSSKASSPAPSSTDGNCDAARVDRVNRLRPALTSAFPDSTLSSILDPSGSDLQISTSFLAGTVISPSVPAESSSTRPTSSTSRSVPVSDKFFPSRLSSTLDKTGSVCRRSTTPATRLSGFKSASREILNFMFQPVLKIRLPASRNSKIKWSVSVINFCSLHEYLCWFREAP